MKKSTILIITAVFLISVFVVGIFGLQNVPYDRLVYVNKIVPTSVTLSNGEESLEIKYSEPNGYYYVTIPYESYQQGMLVMINYDINPTDATNKKLDVTINNVNTNSKGILQENGAIKLEDRGIVDVTYRTQDQSGGAMMTFRIRVGAKRT